MKSYLLFTLVAPMSSMGDVTGHEVRSTALWPGKSQIVGLLCAAMGIKRVEGEKIEALASSISLSVLCRRVGTSLIDFQSTQSAAGLVGNRAMNRAQLLSVNRLKNNLNVTLSHRDYRQDVEFDVCISLRKNSYATLSDLAMALRKPKYVLYFGRKSCPLSAPLAPSIVGSDNVVTAFSIYTGVVQWAGQKNLTQRNPPEFLVVEQKDWETDFADRDLSHQVHTRWDYPVDRESWHFSAQNVVYIPMAQEGML